MPSIMKPRGIDDILEGFNLWGDGLYGEQVSQKQHALQCAQLAVEDGASDSLILAALLHDWGHMLEGSVEAVSPDTDAQHELTGAASLKGLYGPEVTRPIALHVAAKRYLCAVEPGYLDDLSDASRHSLQLQGGPYDEAGARRFAARAGAAHAVRLRRYDDLAKQVGAVTPELEAYIPRLRRLMR